MNKILMISFGLMISSLSNAQFVDKNLYADCDYVQDSLGKIKVTITNEYIDKFSTYDDAENHCMRICQTRAATRIDPQVIQCSAVKDQTGFISTTMSSEFIDNFNSYKEAQVHCWKLHGYEDTIFIY